jgi:hypothetical protein
MTTFFAVTGLGMVVVALFIVVVREIARALYWEDDDATD